MVSLWGKFAPPGLRKNEVKALAVVGGAQVEDWGRSSSSSSPTVVLVADACEGQKQPPRLGERTPVVPTSWLLDSIGNYERQPLAQYLEC